MPRCHRDLDQWKEPVQQLTAAERDKLWQEIEDTDVDELFWVIAGKNTDWIATMVSRPTFSISVRRLLSAVQFQFGYRYPLATLATVLRPLRPDPDELLHTLEIGSFVGEEHERYAAKLDNLRDLADSEDEDLARLGRRGIEIYEPLLKAALLKARRASVHGVDFN